MTTEKADYLSKSRWFDRWQFSEKWSKRNSLLLRLLENVGLEHRQLSFSEYGCGPHRPFKQSLTAIGFDGVIHSLDMNQWQDDVIPVDLEFIDLERIPDSDVGVLSGVLEYLHKPEQVLTCLTFKHQYLLVSYRTFQIEPSGDLEKYSTELNARAKNGWKTHLQLSDLLKVIDNFGFILAAETWRNQTLFLLKKH